MSKSSLRWGVLSTADINRQVLPELRSASRCDLVAVASRSAARAEAYAAEWEIPKGYGSYQALLDDDEIDAVYISLPNSLHCEWTVRAARAGKHVLCEKPLALSEEEVGQIVRAAERADVAVSEAFMYRFHPQTDLVLEFIEDDRIGTPFLVTFSFSFSVAQEQDIRLNPSLGGGALWDLGCYGVNLARLVMGEEPEQAFGWQLPVGSQLDESFAGGLRFPSGGLMHFDSSLRAPRRLRAEIVGTGAGITLTNPVKPHEGGEIVLSNGQTNAIEPPRDNPYRLQAEAFVRQALDGEPARVPLADSLGNVRALRALYRSAAEGRPVHINAE